MNLFKGVLTVMFLSIALSSRADFPVGAPSTGVAVEGWGRKQGLIRGLGDRIKYSIPSDPTRKYSKGDFSFHVTSTHPELFYRCLENKNPTNIYLVSGAAMTCEYEIANQQYLNHLREKGVSVASVLPICVVYKRSKRPTDKTCTEIVLEHFELDGLNFINGACSGNQFGCSHVEKLVFD